MRVRACPHGHGAGRWTPRATVLLLWLLLTLPGLSAWGQTVPRDPDDACFESLGAVHQTMAKPSDDVVARFLQSVHSDDCRGNTEFEEWSTETLFDLMQDAPETFFRVLMHSSKPVEASVVKALESPVDLFIDYPAIYESINIGVRDARVRDYALQIFTPHYQRHLKEQKEWEERNRPKGEARQG